MANSQKKPPEGNAYISHELRGGWFTLHARRHFEQAAGESNLAESIERFLDEVREVVTRQGPMINQAQAREEAAVDLNLTVRMRTLDGVTVMGEHIVRDPIPGGV